MDVPLCRGTDRLYLLDETGHQPLDYWGSAAVGHRPCRGAVLARLCATKTGQTLGPLDGLCGHYGGVRTGAHLVAELYACGLGGGCWRGVGPDISLLAKGTGGTGCEPRCVGCGGLFAVPDIACVGLLCNTTPKICTIKPQIAVWGFFLCRKCSFYLLYVAKKCYLCGRCCAGATQGPLGSINRGSPSSRKP